MASSLEALGGLTGPFGCAVGLRVNRGTGILGFGSGMSSAEISRAEVGDTDCRVGSLKFN